MSLFADDGDVDDDPLFAPTSARSAAANKKSSKLFENGSSDDIFAAPPKKAAPPSGGGSGAPVAPGAAASLRAATAAVEGVLAGDEVNGDEDAKTALRVALANLHSVIAKLRPSS